MIALKEKEKKTSFGQKCTVRILCTVHSFMARKAFWNMDPDRDVKILS
jgi:hypothetical protein